MKTHLLIGILIVFAPLKKAANAPAPFSFVVSICFDGWHRCNGALIEKSWVLTAAHCAQIEDEDPSQETMFELKMGTDTTQRIASAKVFVHGGYDSRYYLDDIALIKTAHPFKLNSKMTSLELDRDGVSHHNVDVYFGSWGKTEEQSFKCMSGRFQILRSKLIEKKKCQEAYSSFKFQKLFAEDKAYCLEPSGPDRCTGDAGGAVLYKKQLIAIISYNAGCQRTPPSICTPISPYITWIDHVIYDNALTRSVATKAISYTKVLLLLLGIVFVRTFISMFYISFGEIS